MKGFIVIYAQQALIPVDPVSVGRIRGTLPRTVLCMRRTRLFDLCRRALVVNDLRRARVPLIFGRAVFPWIFRSPVSLNDGLLSIRRGFRSEELRAGFAQARIERVTIRRRFPYRLVAVAERDG